MVASRWNNQLSLEAEALELVNRGFACVHSVPDADMVAVQGHTAVFVGCSRAASTSMELDFDLELDSNVDDTLALGLRLVEPILARLARANAPWHVVEEVLALWVQEAERTGAGLGSDTCVFAAAGAGAGGTGTGSSGQPALEAYSADMASVRGAPPEARPVFLTAMQATLDHVRARQNRPDVRAALALHACLALERRADEARKAVAAVAAAAAEAAADAGQHAAASDVARTATLAAEEATEVALFRTLAVLPEKFPGAVTGMHESDEWEDTPGAVSGEADPDDLELARLEGEHGGSLTKGQNTYACLPNSTATCPQFNTRVRMLLIKDSLQDDKGTIQDPSSF